MSNISPVCSLYSGWTRRSESTFTQEPTEMINGALSVVVNILGPRNESESGLLIHDSSDNQKNKFKAHKVLFVYGGDDTGGPIGFGVRWIVGVAAFMLGNLSAPLTSHDVSLRRFAVTEIMRINRELALLEKFSEHKRRHPVAIGFVEMLMHERQIFSIVKRNAEYTLSFRVGLVATTVLSFVGAFFAIPDVLLFGSIGMFGFTCAMLLKVGVDSSAFLIRRQAAEVRKYVDYLQSVKWHQRAATIPYPTIRFG